MVDVHAQQVVPEALGQLRLGDSEMRGQQLSHFPCVIGLGREAIDRLTTERAEHAFFLVHASYQKTKFNQTKIAATTAAAKMGRR